MAFLTDPARRPTNSRPNAYERPCAYCGGMVPVSLGTADSGMAFLLWDEYTQKNKWMAAHDDEAIHMVPGKVVLRTCYEAMLALGTDGIGKGAPDAIKGPVAARVVQEAKAAEATLATLADAPAFTMPEAEQFHALMQSALADAVDAVAKQTAEVFTAVVPQMISEGLMAARPVSITVAERPAVTIQRSHKALPDILLMTANGASPFLVGPAGSGKTTLAEQVAQCMGLTFRMASRVTSEYKLVGFTDANGKVVRTQFREAYEHGGVFLFDEVDASDPDALTAFNAALAGKWADFPDGLVARHADFYAIAAGNTFGRGADRQYVGRNQLDAATLDRFQTYEVDYDEQLESQIAGCDPWVNYVQAVRRAIEQEKVRHVVSPRASITGAKLIAAGLPLPKVIASCVWKGMDETTKGRLVNTFTFADQYKKLESYVSSLGEKEVA